MKTLDLAYYVPAFVPDTFGPYRPEKTFWQRVASTLRLWEERYRQRRQLAGLSDHLLEDFGVTRAEARAETAKWFWQA